METLVLVTGSDEIPLHGAGVTTPVRGARRERCTAADGGWRELVDVYLEGRPGEMQAVRERIERAFRPGESARLVMTAYPGAEVVEARLSAGACTALDGSPAGGTGGLRLEMLRCEAWLGAERPVPLSNPGGEDTGAGIILYRKSGTERWNYADLPAETVEGDRPGVMRIELENAGAAESLGDARLCLDAGSGPFGPGLGLAGAANQPLNVTGTAARLTGWTLDDELAARLAGRVVRPAARFATPPEDGAVWAWWQLRNGGTALWESSRELLNTAALQDLPPVYLPALDAPAGLDLELWGKASGSTAAFNLDFVQLCPLDGWRSYRAVIGLPPGGVLVDDGYSGRVYARTAAGEVCSYAAGGAAVQPVPGREQRLYLVHGGSAELPLRLRAWYRPAWGSL